MVPGAIGALLPAARPFQLTVLASIGDPYSEKPGPAGLHSKTNANSGGEPPITDTCRRLAGGDLRHTPDAGRNIDQSDAVYFVAEPE